MTHVVTNPDSNHIGGFVDVFDAFEVDSLYVSGDPTGTLTYNTFVRGEEDGLGWHASRRVSPETPSPWRCDSVPRWARSQRSRCGRGECIGRKEVTEGQIDAKVLV
jgi:hypothetical protein